MLGERIKSTVEILIHMAEALSIFFKSYFKVPGVYSFTKISYIKICAASKGMDFELFWSEIGYGFYLFWPERGLGFVLWSGIRYYC